MRAKRQALPAKAPKLRRSELDPVFFSFEYLHNISFSESNCADRKFFASFLLRLQKLSQLGWSKLNAEKRHGYGWEKIPLSAIKPSIRYTPAPDLQYLLCFRAGGDNRVFLGIRQENTFYILFIEAQFGDIYNHG